MYIWIKTISVGYNSSTVPGVSVDTPTLTTVQLGSVITGRPGP